MRIANVAVSLPLAGISPGGSYVHCVLGIAPQRRSTATASACRPVRWMAGSVAPLKRVHIAPLVVHHPRCALYPPVKTTAGRPVRVALRVVHFEIVAKAQPLRVSFLIFRRLVGVGQVVAEVRMSRWSARPRPARHRPGSAPPRNGPTHDIPRLRMREPVPARCSASLIVCSEPSRAADADAPNRFRVTTLGLARSANPRSPCAALASASCLR